MEPIRPCGVVVVDEPDAEMLRGTMNPLLRKAVITAVSGAFLLGTAANSMAAPAPEEGNTDQGITCESNASGEGAFYSGPSASDVYDKAFGKGPAVPGLDEYTPQGISTWSDWDGSGNDLLLVTSYGEPGQDARIIGIDPKTGKHVGTVAIAESHVGGIAVGKGWAFVQGRNSGKWGTIRKYRLTELRDAMKQGGTPYLKQVGNARNVYAASFLSSYGDTLYSGKFNGGGRGNMYSYKIGDDGSLTTEHAYEVPTKTQGLMVTKDKFVFTASYGRDNRSNIYVVDKGATDIDKPSTKCFRAPSMAEGITEYGGDAYLLFESGSYKYRDARNVIENLHEANISTITNF
ncbi:hypothetical protein MOQ72_39970 [Saccharopolyspora sp. K220]|uniref:hypothetical protein n=1 Tax=Saccharopolyspora soli TaxID=2926618 RepID=UPI001F570206|nr:hypothetical protein [Saccharopolyspora soli]MCI2423601.1 hypothetical protein [Saccharopolyspora soli]